MRPSPEDFDIINCSFACGISGHLSLYKEWTDRALVKGVHVVAASHGEEPEWPAHFASVLAVDYAESEMDEGQISYSEGRMVGFSAAPDSEVPWKDGTHRSMTGSSFAAALMTGIVARLLSVYPIRDPLLLKALLRRSTAAKRIGIEWSTRCEASPSCNCSILSNNGSYCKQSFDSVGWLRARAK